VPITWDWQKLSNGVEVKFGPFDPHGRYEADVNWSKKRTTISRRLHRLQANTEMERIMTAEDVFELEQRRIVEDCTRELRKQLAEEQRRREDAERELERLRKLLGDSGKAV
jgi:hypothetical protein